MIYYMKAVHVNSLRTLDYFCLEKGSSEIYDLFKLSLRAGQVMGTATFVVI